MIDTTAAQREAWSHSWSSTIRTARSRTSGAYLFVVLLVIAPHSHELEPPANPARFKLPKPSAYHRLLNTKAGSGPSHAAVFGDRERHLD